MISVATPKARTWLVTGASSGIGQRLSQRLLESGNRVVAAVRNPAKLADLSVAFPETLIPFHLDLSEPETIGARIDRIFAEVGEIDVLMSGAGYALIGAVEEVSADQVNRALDVNLRAPIMLIKSVLPKFRRRRSGHIMHISSEGGHVAYPSASIYHASKWGIGGFCESLAQEIRPFGLHVTLIEPGRVETEFDDNAVLADETIEAYRKTTVGRYLLLMKMGRFPRIGDPEKIAVEIFRLADDPAPPFRLVLGSDSYANIESELRKRLSSVKEQAGTAASTDFDKSRK